MKFILTDQEFYKPAKAAPVLVVPVYVACLTCDKLISLCRPSEIRAWHGFCEEHKEASGDHLQA